MKSVIRFGVALRRHGVTFKQYNAAFDRMLNTDFGLAPKRTHALAVARCRKAKGAWVKAGRELTAAVDGLKVR